ncbi:MAG: hypothetical protein HY033_07860 [Ignavibacteriae bacterium]|nr:hypothetical protein [Ignavibacteria bacterium]MBI3364807.1 hypothetical protein [Ignavibacteriota bacterium]
MPLLEEEQKLPQRKLLIVGIPSFIIALALSLLIHQWAHVVVFKHACGADAMRLIRIMDLNGTHTGCPLSSLAGTAATFCLALASFALYMRFPHSLFLGSMAFINAILRLPEAVTVFFQLLVNRKASVNVDESAAVALLRLQDPAAATVILCFFSLTIFFLAVTIIHDTRMVPKKWAIALGLFIVMIPLESLLWRLIVPMIG